MSIQTIKEDIKGLRGSNVTIFGQPTTLNSEVNEGLIDILDILDKLEEHEAELVGLVYNEEIEEDEEKEFETVEEYVDFMEDEIGDWKEVVSDNTYNWSAPVSNDFSFVIYKDMNNGYHYVKMMVHRFGDVRGNYTDYALLRFDSQDDFLYAVSECNKTVDLDENHYVDVNVLSNGYEVYTKDGEFVDTIYDLDDWNVQGELAEG